MSHDWMIRILEDLQRYARLNGMPALSEHLGQAVLLAMAEAAGPKDREARDPRGGS